MRAEREGSATHTNEESTIDAGDRGGAILAHLSGLAGYLLPCGGVVVPLLIWLLSSRKLVATIAKQALWLNVAAFTSALLIAGSCWLGTLALHLEPPTMVVLLLGGGALAVLLVSVVLLPVIGAIRAANGRYYRYPLVGISAPSP